MKQSKKFVTEWDFVKIRLTEAHAAIWCWTEQWKGKLSVDWNLEQFRYTLGNFNCSIVYRTIYYVVSIYKDSVNYITKVPLPRL